MNGIIVIDKPSEWTSHDVVGKLRTLLCEKRIGHGGTLDPMATGVLPIFVGRATRAVPFCENAVKEYLAWFRPGIITDTQDITGTVAEKNTVCFSDEELQAVLSRFTGEIKQIPPMYSAVKVNGKKLYELARKGVEIERQPRNITVYSLTTEGRRGEDYILRIRCSKGTYVRTLCHDIGRTLGCGGCLAGLRRTEAGTFSLADAVTLEQVEKAVKSGTQYSLLRPVDSLFSDRPAVVINAVQAKACRNGNDFAFYSNVDGEYRVYDENGVFLMLGRCENQCMKTVKSFFETGEQH